MNKARLEQSRTQEVSLVQECCDPLLPGILRKYLMSKRQGNPRGSVNYRMQILRGGSATIRYSHVTI